MKGIYPEKGKFISGHSAQRPNKSPKSAEIATRTYMNGQMIIVGDTLPSLRALRLSQENLNICQAISVQWF